MSASVRISHLWIAGPFGTDQQTDRHGPRADISPLLRQLVDSRDYSSWPILLLTFPSPISACGRSMYVFPHQTRKGSHKNSMHPWLHLAAPAQRGGLRPLAAASYVERPGRSSSLPTCGSDLATAPDPGFVLGSWRVDLIQSIPAEAVQTAS